MHSLTMASSARCCDIVIDASYEKAGLNGIAKKYCELLARYLSFDQIEGLDVVKKRGEFLLGYNIDPEFLDNPGDAETPLLRLKYFSRRLDKKGLGEIYEAVIRIESVEDPDELFTDSGVGLMHSERTLRADVQNRVFDEYGLEKISKDDIESMYDSAYRNYMLALE
jgi:hypothetical protein